LARLLLDQIAGLTEKVAGLDAELRRRVTTDDTAPMETFSKGRDFAARVGLTPRHHSSGGKERLGRTSKMGRRDIRGLLIIGAVAAVRRAARKGASEGS
jgi:transposase